jgi:hypothetical protein
MSAVVRSLIALCGLAAACDATLAENSRWIIWGAGNDSCGKFVQEQARDSARFGMEISWIAGVVTAENAEWLATLRKRGIKSDPEFLKGVDHATLETWLVNHCKAHPLDNLS